MASNPKFDFASALAQAGKSAGEQEKRSSELLREIVFSRADQDPGFKRALAANPEKVLEDEARRVGAQVDAELVKEAKDKYSTAIIGASEEDVTKLVFETLGNVRTSFQRTLTLSQYLFFVGLGLTIAAFIVSLIWQEKQLVAGIFGGGGILTLISYAVMNPLDRIRNAAANLVQIQIAYVSYYKQLNLLGGAESQAATIEDAVKYSTELRRGAVETIDAVQRIVAATAPYDPRITHGSAKPQTGGEGAGG